MELLLGRGRAAQMPPTLILFTYICFIAIMGADGINRGQELRAVRRRPVADGAQRRPKAAWQGDRGDSQSARYAAGGARYP